jgi:hypothetical protein
MKRLNLTEQRTLMRAIPASRRGLIRQHCCNEQMKGKGVKSILKSVVKVLGPVAKELGPTVLKQLVLPMIKKKMGMGINVAGGSLRLAGQGRKRRVGRPRIR